MRLPIGKIEGVVAKNERLVAGRFQTQVGNVLYQSSEESGPFLEATDGHMLARVAVNMGEYEDNKGDVPGFIPPEVFKEGRRQIKQGVGPKICLEKEAATLPNGAAFARPEMPERLMDSVRVFAESPDGLGEPSFCLNVTNLVAIAEAICPKGREGCRFVNVYLKDGESPILFVGDYGVGLIMPARKDSVPDHVMRLIPGYAKKAEAPK